MKCPNCNGEVPEGKRFCGHCGHKLEVIVPFDDDAATRVGESPWMPKGDADDDIVTQIDKALISPDEDGKDKGEVYQTAKEGKQSAPNMVICTKCGKTNPPDAHYCSYCSVSLVETPIELVPQTRQKLAAPLVVPRNAKPKRSGIKWVEWLAGGLVLVTITVAIIQGSQPSSRRLPTAIPVEAPPPTLAAEPTTAPLWELYEESIFLEGEDYDHVMLAAGVGDFYASFDIVMHENFGEEGYVCPFVQTGYEINSTAWILLENGRIAFDVVNEVNEEFSFTGDWMDVAAMKIGVETLNTIAVVAKDGLLSWYINGEPITAYEYPTRDMEHVLEWANCDPITVSVNNISVNALP